MKSTAQPTIRPTRLAPPARNVGLAWLALLTTLAMFPLIWFGGLTTSHGAGLSVPDWPNTYGYNMFAAPWSLWLGGRSGGVFFEHTHRLLGSLVGFLALSTCLYGWGVSAKPKTRRAFGWSAVVLAVLAVGVFAAMKLVGDETLSQHLGHGVSGFGGLAAVCTAAWLARRREPRRWVRWAATALLLAVITQGLLGGFRVTEVSLTLAIIHGIFAQCALCLAGTLALVTGRWWANVPDRFTAAAPRVGVAALTLTAVVLCQLTVAALMRHHGAGLAVPDFPLSYGRVVPPTSADGLARANGLRMTEYALPTTSLGAIWLHTAHRFGAVLVTLGVIWVSLEMFRVEQVRRLSAHAWTLVGLLAVQICLGVTTVWMQKPADVATAHVATGALLLLTSCVLTVRVCRLYGWRPWRVSAPIAEPRRQPAELAVTA